MGQKTDEAYLLTSTNKRKKTQERRHTYPGKFGKACKGERKNRSLGSGYISMKNI